MLTEKNVSVSTKGTKENYVTSTDLEIQRFLRKELTSILPGSEFMGEEKDLPDGTDRYDTDRYVWVVDPIDGTANYARGIPMSVVSIALVHDHRSVLGVVRQPYLGETFYASEGQGAYLNGTRIHVSHRTREHCMVCTAWSCYNKKRAALCFEVSSELYSECEDIRRIGTAAYELCLLAKGACDIYFEALLSPWDYAAAACIVKEAGGHLSSNQPEIDFYTPCTVMAANAPENLEYVRNVVKKACSEHPEAEITIKDRQNPVSMAKKLEDYVTTIPDFPEPGIMFRDVTTIVQSPEGFKMAIDQLVDRVKDLDFEYIVGTESRGFIFGAPVAYALGKGFVLARKKGKLPRQCVSQTYDLEYGQATLEMHKDSFPPGSRIVIIDDLVATGGTTKAVCKMIEELGGKVVRIGFVMELAGFQAREKVLNNYDVFSLITYPGN